MPKLVVIGNGFDIAHGMPTKFLNFMQFLSHTHSSPLQNSSEPLTDITCVNDEKHLFYNKLSAYISKEKLWKDFEKALADIDDKRIQNENRYLMLSYGDDNWSDSAHHDFQYAVSEALSFADEIPHYLLCWINSIDTHVNPRMSKDIINADNIFLSFNYTNTLETVYGIPESRITYIHGKAACNDKLIAGHHSEAYKDNTPPKFSSKRDWEEWYIYHHPDDVRAMQANDIVKQYFDATYKDTLSIIAEHSSFFASLHGIKEVCICGHSLSDIDGEYFSAIKRNVDKNCLWRISYHDANDKAAAERFVHRLNIENYQLFQS